MKWSFVEPENSHNFAVIEDEEGATYSPFSVLPSGEIAAEVVWEWAQDKSRTPEELKKAGTFLRYWPEGPQLKRVPGLMGPPRKWPSTTRITVRVPDQFSERIPEPKSQWIIKAIQKNLEESVRGAATQKNEEELLEDLSLRIAAYRGPNGKISAQLRDISANDREFARWIWDYCKYYLRGQLR